MASDAQNRRSGADGSLRGRLAPSRRLRFDVLAVTTWVLAVAATLHGAGVPAWLYYAVVVAGVVAYSLLAAYADAVAGRARHR